MKDIYMNEDAEYTSQTFQMPTAPVKSAEENEIIDTLFRIQKIDEDIRTMAQQKRENPLLVFSGIGFDIRMEALEWKKEQLRNKNRRLSRFLDSMPAPMKRTMGRGSMAPVFSVSREVVKAGRQLQERIQKNHLDTLQEDKELSALRTIREGTEHREDREIVTNQNGITEIVTYNQHVKETVVRDTDGQERVSYEAMTPEQQEQLDELAERIEYYSDLNDSMEQEKQMDVEDSKVLNELEGLREGQDEDMERE